MPAYYLIPILLLVLLPLLYALHYFGILVTRATASWFRADFSLPTRWEGRFNGTTGLMRRNFVIFRKYHTLAIQLETDDGTLDFAVTGPDGSALSPASGVFGQTTSVRIDVSRLKRCTVALRMEGFGGSFRIELQ